MTTNLDFSTLHSFQVISPYKTARQRVRQTDRRTGKACNAAY